MQLHTTKMMMGLCVILHIPFGKTWPYLSLSTRMEPRRRKCITIIHPQLQRRPLTLARSFFYALSTSFFGWKSLMRFYYASYSLHWDESVERKVWFPSVVYCMLSLCRQDEDQNCANFAKYPCSCSARLLTTKTLLCCSKKDEREARMSNVRRRTDTHRISLHRWDDGNMEQIFITCIVHTKQNWGSY